MQPITTLAPQRAFQIVEAGDASGSHAVDGMRACPACHRLTPSLKEYTFCLWVFLGLGIRLSTPIHVACPACMRKAIGKNSLINLFSANVLWPFVVLPWVLVLLASSFSPGHSRAGEPLGKADGAAENADEATSGLGALGWILFATVMLVLCGVLLALAFGWFRLVLGILGAMF